MRRYRPLAISKGLGLRPSRKLWELRECGIIIISGRCSPEEVAMGPSRGRIRICRLRPSPWRAEARFLAVVIAFAISTAAGFDGRSAGWLGRGAPPAARQETKTAEKVSTLLKEIFKEVMEIGPYPGEEIVRREFFVGEGDDDTYKDYHLVVLIQDVPGGRKMTLQVTRLVPESGNPRIKKGRDSKLVVCVTNGGRLDLVKSDYSEKELSSFLPDLLRAIRDRKKLVRDRL